MTRIKCRGCGKKIDKLMSICPNCGFANFHDCLTYQSNAVIQSTKATPNQEEGPVKEDATPKSKQELTEMVGPALKIFLSPLILLLIALLLSRGMFSLGIVFIFVFIAFLIFGERKRKPMGVDDVLSSIIMVAVFILLLVSIFLLTGNLRN